VYCLNVPFLKTVKHNNFVPYNLSLHNCGHEKSQCYPENEEFGPEKGLLWRRGRRVLLLLLLPWCSKYFCNKKE